MLLKVANDTCLRGSSGEFFKVGNAPRLGGESGRKKILVKFFAQLIFFLFFFTFRPGNFQKLIVSSPHFGVFEGDPGRKVKLLRDLGYHAGLLE